jgi:cellulose synthase/poly-beta-1,6-N-acetylglucosamine synthase-like glycosyltransferase
MAISETRSGLAGIQPVKDITFVPVINRPPLSWIDSSLLQITGRIPEKGTVSDFRAAADRRWQMASGFEVGESSFLLVVPIHDEEKSLRDFFEVLKTANLPVGLNARIVLATNACTDQSTQYVREFLESYGKPLIEPVQSGRDDKLDQECLTVQTGNLKYTHINTDKPGKANVLSVANDMARKDGIRIVMCSDANNYPEPDALAVLYGNAKSLIEPENSNTVIVWGTNKAEPKSSWQRRLVKGLVDASKGLDKASPVGNLFAWDSKWLDEIGGVPSVAIEDRALSVAAVVGGKDMERDESAITHGFIPNNPLDYFRYTVRHIRGTMQIRRMGPEYEEIVNEAQPNYQEKVWDRLALRLSKVKEGHPFIKEMVRFFYFEAAMFVARREFKRNPENQSWTKIQSTN